MKFETASAQRRNTHVKATPSHIDGYFRFDDFSGQLTELDEIDIHGVKPRHLKALEKGNQRTINHYADTYSVEPFTFFFQNCDVSTPDPNNPDNILPIDHIKETSPYIAVGEWWGQRLLNPIVDLGTGHIMHRELAATMHGALAPKVGKFVRVLTEMSYELNHADMSTYHEPDLVLSDAMARAGMKPGMLVSTGSFTRREGDTIVAQVGRSGEETQIWPPVPPKHPGLQH